MQFCLKSKKIQDVVTKNMADIIEKYDYSNGHIWNAKLPVLASMISGGSTEKAKGAFAPLLHWHKINSIQGFGLEVFQKF